MFKQKLQQLHIPAPADVKQSQINGYFVRHPQQLRHFGVPKS